MSKVPSEIAEIRYLTVLRVITTFAVVLLHVSGIFVTQIGNTNRIGWWMANFIDSSVRWCVPVFVLISGALLLDPDKAESLDSFYKKRCKRIIIPIIFWSLIYFCMRVLVGKHGLPLNIIINDIIYGVPYYHLWYLYMTIGLYLFTPCLRSYIKSSNRKERVITLISIFTISSIYEIAVGLPKIIIVVFLPYIGYFICGYHLRIMNCNKIRINYLVIMIIICVISITILTGYFPIKSDVKNGLLTYSNFNPAVIAMSLAIFVLFNKLKDKINLIRPLINYLINKLASASLGIYVIHPIVIASLIKIFSEYNIFNKPFIFIMALSLFSFALSTIITLVIIRLPYLRRTVT